MIHNGYVRIATASPSLKVADISYNKQQIKEQIIEAVNKKINIIVFPELCITGYTCSDLFFQNELLNKVEESLIDLALFSDDLPIVFSVGAPLRNNGQLFNCSILICQGNILGVVPKTHLPNYNEFYEQRWFSSAYNLDNTTITISDTEIPFGTEIIFQHASIRELKIAVEICEDLWVPIPPSSFSALAGATIILNNSASNEIVGKSNYRKQLIKQQSARTMTAYAYCSSGFGESTTDLVYGGHCLIYENGVALNENKIFSMEPTLIYSDIDLELISHDRMQKNSYYDINLTKDYAIVEFEMPINEPELNRIVHPYPFVPKNDNAKESHCKEIFSIQTLGLAKRLQHIGCDKVVVGISGGLDSTLALLVCVKTFDLLNLDRKNIIGITMPGFGTTDRTYTNAIKLMEQLGVDIREISIKDACLQHFRDIGHDPSVHDVTYENVQARERTQLLMDISNKEEGIVIGTGDLSELALGWATYNGDHMSMYAVNTSIPKTLVRYLIGWISETQVKEEASEILKDVMDTPVSPELLPPSKDGTIKQKTEDLVGPYELHDFFLYQIMRYGFAPKKVYFLACIAFKGEYSNETILKWLKKFYWRFFSQQFKRSCLPDGPKVGSICISPRGDWRMPSDAVANLWLSELDNL